MSQVDLRTAYDDRTNLTNGVIYRKGNIVQAWWSKNVLGETLKEPLCETWTLPDERQGQLSFQRLVERWID